jgi:hypothetical protein
MKSITVNDRKQCGGNGETKAITIELFTRNEDLIDWKN